MLRYRRGTTDSELAFLWILGRIRRVARGGLEGGVPVEQIVRAVQDALLSIENWCREEGATEAPGLNFLLTDGRCLVASRQGNTAYWVLREDVVRCEVCGVCHCSICGSDLGRRHQPRPGYRAVVVASEPITSESWTEIPEGHLLVVDEGWTVSSSFASKMSGCTGPSRVPVLTCATEKFLVELDERRWTKAGSGQPPRKENVERLLPQRNEPRLGSDGRNAAVQRVSLAAEDRPST